MSIEHKVISPLISRSLQDSISTLYTTVFFPPDYYRKPGQIVKNIFYKTNDDFIGPQIPILNQGLTSKDAHLVRRSFMNSMYQAFGEALVMPTAGVAAFTFGLETLSKFGNTPPIYSTPEDLKLYCATVTLAWSVLALSNLFTKRKKILFEDGFQGPRLPHAYLLIGELTNSTYTPAEMQKARAPADDTQKPAA